MRCNWSRLLPATPEARAAPLPRPPPLPRTDRTGAAFEALARTYLEAAGLRWLAANVRYRIGELDLVMREGATVVFVEVRYRHTFAFGGSAPSVDARKQRKLVLAAQCFLADHPALAREPCRFDVVAIQGAPAQPQIHWLRAAFDAA